MDVQMLPEPLYSLVNGELESGERVRWAGQPEPSGRVGWGALVPILFAIPWTAFSLFWMAAAGGFVPPFGDGKLDASRMVFSLFGIPFVLVGLGMLSSPFWIRRRVRKAAAATVYMVTDRRAVVFDGGYFGDYTMAGLLGGVVARMRKGTSVRSYAPSQIGQIERIQRPDGSGDLLFGEPIYAELADSSQMSGRQLLPQRGGFFSIPEVKHVAELLEQLVDKAKS